MRKNIGSGQVGLLAFGWTALVSSPALASPRGDCKDLHERLAPQTIEGNIGSFLSDLGQAALLVICVILLHRTAVVLERSRFLSHLAHAFTITAFFYAGRVVVALLKTQIAWQAVLACTDGGTIPHDPVETLSRIDGSFVALDTLMSLFSSFWLLSSGYLLAVFPKVGLPKDLYTKLIGGFGAAAAIIAVVITANAERIKAQAVVFILLDTLIAMVSICYVGYHMAWKLRPSAGKHVLPMVTVVTFGGWGLLQPFYLVFWLRQDSGGPRYSFEATYFMLLLLAKLGACFVAIMMASLSLKPKAPYDDSGTVASGDPIGGADYGTKPKPMVDRAAAKLPVHPVTEKSTPSDVPVDSSIQPRGEVNAPETVEAAEEEVRAEHEAEEANRKAAEPKRQAKA